MVTVSNVIERQGADGSFAVLELKGGLELVQSSNTGRFYATVRKCTIPCTLEMAEAKAFIGAELPGSIQKVECDPYEYTVESTGEEILLSHRWEFVPEMKAATPVVEMAVSRRA